ncbi:MAG: response regulator transcription factor [Bacteroidetes bacterium]|nr:response regulator transcription factor [Bacteroidota bacterium]
MSSILKVILVDDEKDSLTLLQLQLEKHCPDVVVAGVFTDPREAKAAIELHKPDIVFTDIEMPTMSGFQLLEQTQHCEYAAIFITAYNQYAIRAFRFNALDYLLKPIDTGDLLNAVAKARKKMRPNAKQIETVQKQIQGERISKIAVSSQTGISFISFNDIIYIEASNNYSKIYTTGGTYVVSRTLKDVQDTLEESHFLRIHRQYIVNLNHVVHLNRNEGILTMGNKAMLPVARNQKDRLIARYEML